MLVIFATLIPTSYILDNVPLAASTCVRDLGMWIDDKLKFHEHTSVTIAKANRILALMKRSFNINMNIFLRLYTTLIHPILEYRIHRLCLFSSIIITKLLMMLSLLPNLLLNH